MTCRSRARVLMGAVLAFAGCGGEVVPRQEPQGARAALCRDDGKLAELVDPTAAELPALEPITVRVTTADTAGLAAVESGEPDAEVRVHFEQGDYGAGDAEPNATLRTRGLSIREAAQKSYRIKLRGEPLWEGQEIVFLNKHPFDLTRVRQKLSFDVIAGLPHMASPRTRFVRLFINDQDMGLYTQVERADEHTLANHQLPAGPVYKPVFFDFQQLDPRIWADSEKLAEIIEAETETEDTAKLRRLVDAVNDPGQAIDDVVERHLQRDNYLTWLAMNVLMGNWDMGASNFLLYSPAGCEGWYFLPWDYDGAWGWYEQPDVPSGLRPRWRAGLTVYWGSALHARFLKVAANVAAVEQRMGELASVITDEHVSGLLAGYRPIVEPFIAARPDVDFLPVGAGRPDVAGEAWRAEMARVATLPGAYRREYDQVRERPAPIWLNALVRPTSVYFEWGLSHDFQGDGLAYDFQLASSPDFLPASVVEERLELTAAPGEVVLSVALPALPAGHYFWRVLVRDTKSPAENWQEPFTVYGEVEVPSAQ